MRIIPIKSVFIIATVVFTVAAFVLILWGHGVLHFAAPVPVPVEDAVDGIEEIIVIAHENEACWDYGFNIIRPDRNILSITPGQAYSRKATFQLRDFDLCGGNLLEVDYTERNIIMGARGGYGLLEEGGFFVLKGDRINYISADRRQEIEDVRGVLLDAPAGSIMDHYSDVLYYILDNNERVLTILIDGFGYHQYAYAIENDYAPFLASLPGADKVTALYRPITNVGLAAMITGKPPEYSGVYGRQRELKVPSLFGVLKDRGKDAVFIGGRIRILNKEIYPVFNVDRNKCGTVDDEIFASAMEHLKSEPGEPGYDFVMVHFHNVDDSGEIYGDLHPETMQAIKRMDGYVAELVRSWPGRVIIISDHGMHSVGDGGGGHGSFRFEDLIVPYIRVHGEG